MKWVKACISHKLVIYLVAMLICVAGLFCLYIIPVSPFPSMSFNGVYVTLNYPGASAQTVQKQVTEKVVNALSGNGNIKRIYAHSYAGQSEIDIILASATPDKMLQAQMYIMQAVAASHLPSTVSRPDIQFDSSSSGLLSYRVTSDKLTPFALYNFIQSTLVPAFKSMPGVVVGSNEKWTPVVRISLLPAKMAEYHLSSVQVTERINSSYRAFPLGQLAINRQAYTLSLKNETASLVQLGNLIVGYQVNSIGNPVYLKDVATITFAPRSLVNKDYSEFNGQRAGGIGLSTRTRANPFQVSALSRNYVKTLERTLPADIKITPVFDMASVMKASFDEVVITVGIASALVLLIALIFLGRFRTTLVPVITIPICLAASVVATSMLGMSVNILTLLSMVIAVGLVVDDAIVVLENITRHHDSGLSVYNAVLKGTSEIAVTIIGITATLLAVYLPVTFFKGFFATLLTNFAVPLSAAVFVSGIIALTLTPLMCLALVSCQTPNRYQQIFEHQLHRVIQGYQYCLNSLLKRPRLMLLVIAGIMSITSYLAFKLPQGFFPKDPDGMAIIQIIGGPQDTISSLRKEVARFNTFYHSNNTKYYSIDIQTDPDSGRLTASAQIQYKAQYLSENARLVDQINQFIKQHQIKNAVAVMPAFMNAGSGSDVSLYIYGADDNYKIDRYAETLTKLMRKSPMFMHVSETINLPHKQLEFTVNAVKAAKVGLFKPDIAKFLSVMYGGYALDNNFTMGQLSVPIIVQMKQSLLKDPSSVQELQIQSPVTGKFYPVSDFIHLTTVAKPEIISTFDNQPTVKINASLANDHDLGEALPFIDQLMQTYFPAVHYQYTGNAEQYLGNNNQSLFIFVLGLLCVYTLLVIIFRSLSDPLIIMLTVPFTVIGGALSLYLVQGSLNLFSILGLITLVGLITKHGILIVQFANKELVKDATVKEAIMSATRHRFRPIIMTTLAMTLGVLPLVFSHDIMYVSRQQLGVTLVGGLLVGTLFSLFIVPLVYVLLKNMGYKNVRWHHKTDQSS